MADFHWHIPTIPGSWLDSAESGRPCQAEPVGTGPGGGMDRCCCETFGTGGGCIAGSLIGAQCDFGGSPVIRDVQISGSAIR